MIEVILMERIESLGTLGQVVKVRPGFARNFLLPQKKALRATKTNLEIFEKQRAELEARNAQLRAEAETASKKVEGLKLIVIRQASEAGHLYGSVSARDVADAADAAKQKIERSQVDIPQPIKELGLFPVRVKLHPEVSVIITINVARSEEEARQQELKAAAAAKKTAEASEAEAFVEAAPVSDAAEDAPKKKKAGKAKAETTKEA